MRFNQLSELVIIPEKEGDGKMNAEEYCDIIMDGEMFDFWVKGSEEIGCLLMIEDGAAYHKGCATKSRPVIKLSKPSRPSAQAWLGGLHARFGLLGGPFWPLGHSSLPSPPKGRRELELAAGLG